MRRVIRKLEEGGYIEREQVFVDTNVSVSGGRQIHFLVDIEKHPSLSVPDGPENPRMGALDKQEEVRHISREVVALVLKG